MVCLEKLDRSDFEEVYRIMEQSFPADERRKKEGQQKLLDEEKYELLGYLTPRGSQRQQHRHPSGRNRHYPWGPAGRQRPAAGPAAGQPAGKPSR